MNKKNNRKGFTIVELVIVIAVIAILATVLVPTFGNIIEKANKSAAIQEAKNLFTNYVTEQAETGAYNDDVIIEVEEDEVYVAVVDGAVVNAVYDSATDAEAAFAKDGFTVTAGTQEGQFIPVTVAPEETSEG